MNQDPSVLDFIKTHIRYWRHKIIHPSTVMEEATESEFRIMDTEKPAPVMPGVDQTSIEISHHFSWRILLVLGLGLLAQLSLEPHQGSERTWHVGVILYVLAGFVLIRINWRHECELQAWEVKVPEISPDTTFL